MKLLRHGPPGKEKPALLDATGVLRDLSAVLPDIGPAQLSDTALARLARLNPERLPAVGVGARASAARLRASASSSPSA